MKIIRLSAQNVKKLKAVSITPQGNVIQITGPNASGKTSVLDCIYMALAGASAIPTKPVREGEESAKITLDLGECIVTRKFTSDGKSTLTVEAANGSRFPSPQRMLDSLLSGLSFDPLAFTRFEPKKRLDTLKSLVKLDVDADQLDGLNQRDYEARTEINREAKRMEAQLSAIRIPLTEKADLELDEPALLKELAEAATINSEIEKTKQARLTTQSRIDSLTKAIDLRQKEIEQLQIQLTAAGDTLLALDGTPTPAPIDIAQVRAKVERARVASEAKRLLSQRDQLTQELKEKLAEADLLTTHMSERLKQKEEAIARAEMPVKGLAFGDGEVYFKGVPFAQASSAEQLVVSTVIAMRANPKLRVIRIQDGSLLDSHNLELIGKLAEKGDYQVWIETVQTSDPMAIHMEDGQVVAQPEPEGEKVTA